MSSKKCVFNHLYRPLIHLSRNRYFRRTRGIELQRKRARPLFLLKDGKKEKERENRIQFPPIE